MMRRIVVSRAPVGLHVTGVWPVSKVAPWPDVKLIVETSGGLGGRPAWCAVVVLVTTYRVAAVTFVVLASSASKIALIRPSSFIDRSKVTRRPSKTLSKTLCDGPPEEYVDCGRITSEVEILGDKRTDTFAAATRLQREFSSRGLVVIGVNTRETKEAARRYAKELGLTFALLLDRDGKINALYGVVGLPTTFLIGRDGRAIGFAVGPREWDSRSGRALITALLAEPAPPRAAQ